MGSEAAAGAGAAAQASIRELLPHRPPFLFLDRVIAREAERIETEWRVPEDLDCLRGHYPGHPLLPGVLLLEMAFQSGAVLLGAGPRVAGELPVLATVRDARFKGTVGPGETLRAELRVEQRLANATYLAGRVSAGPRTVLRLRFVLALAALEGPRAEGA